MADKLTIGDKGSIEARNKGRAEFEEKEKERLQKELGGDVQCPTCPYDDIDCDGPNVAYVFEDDNHGNLISWECSHEKCPCCGDYVSVSNFDTTMQGTHA